MKVSALEGAELDYWVAKAIGKNTEIVCDEVIGPPECVMKNRGGIVPFAPSASWKECGPLIEKRHIEMSIAPDRTWWAIPADGFAESGPTPLIAACRAIVASVYGKEVPSE